MPLSNPPNDFAPDATKPRKLNDPRHGALIVSGLVALPLIVLAVLLPTPYVVESPGPTFNTIGENQSTPLIQIEGREAFPAAGHLDLTTVYVTGGPQGRVNIFDAFEAWVDPTEAVLPVELVYLPGTTQSDIQEQNSLAMDSSQETAVAAALTQMDIDYSQQLFVAGFAEESAAEGKLMEDDRLLEIMGVTITDIDLLRDELNTSAGEPVEITVDRNGETVTERITPHESAEGDFQLGVFLGENFDFPFTVNIALNNVGGPSAGMMFALGIVDKLTEGDMTGGKFFAGTGTINSAGTVGPIGGIAQKMAGAASAGAEFFLAPAANCGDVRGNIPDGLEVFSVETLDQAATVVQTIGADGDQSELPTCAAE